MNFVDWRDEFMNSPDRLTIKATRPEKVFNFEHFFPASGASGCHKVLVAAEALKALAPLFAITVQSIVDDGIGFCRWLNLIDFYSFAF